MNLRQECEHDYSCAAIRRHIFACSSVVMHRITPSSQAKIRSMTDRPVGNIYY